MLQVLDKEEILSIANIDNISFLIFYGIQVVLMIGVAWFFAVFWRRSSFRDLGFRYYNILKAIWYTFVALIVIFFMSFSYVFIIDSLFAIEAPASKVEQLIRERSISTNILIVIVAVVAPFAEEVYFRGFLYTAFKKSWGVNAGLFLSSLLFAAAHMEVYSFIPVMIIGWILAYIFEKTKSLVPVIFLHSAYNLILILIMLRQIDFVRMY